jgi:hypothetical protein
MSQALLMELNEEIRRLYIAGSDLAAGDYRLKRLLPSFEQLGERAPVFKKLGEGIAALIDEGAGTDTARRLQDVNLLLQSVLRTQGKGAAEGETAPLRTQPVRLEANLSYRKLSAVRTALTTRGGGRHEVIVEAFREGLFRDVRLVPLAIEALNDPYVEIAEFAMNDILPSYGPDIVPHLLESFRPDGGKLEARKLTVIARNGGKDVLDVVHKASVSGSDEVRTTAIRLLAGHPEYEQVLLDFSRDKKKSIREAAFQALAASDRESAAERLYEAFTGKDRETVSSSVMQSRSELLNGWLVRDLSELVASVREGTASQEEMANVWNEVRRYIWALHQKTSPELGRLYMDVMRNYKLYMYKLGWAFLANEAMAYIQHEHSEEGRQLVRAAVELDLKKHAQTASFARDLFKKALPVLPPERLFEAFGTILEERAKASSLSRSANEAKQLMDTIEDMVVIRRYREIEQIWSYGETGYTYHVEMPPQEELAGKWDPRWLDHFIALDRMALVSAFARPGHAEAASYLLDKLKRSPEFRNRFANLAVMGLVRAGVSGEELHEALVRAVEDERNTDCREIEPFLFDQLCRLPASYADRIRAALPKFGSVSAEQLEYVLKTMESSNRS